MQTIIYDLFEQHIIDLEDDEDNNGDIILRYKPTKDYIILLDNVYIVDSLVEVYWKLEFDRFIIYFDMPIRTRVLYDVGDRLKVYRRYDGNKSY